MLTKLFTKHNKNEVYFFIVAESSIMTDGPRSSVSKMRSSAQKELFGETYKEVPEYELKSKLPPGIYLLGQMIHLCRTVEKGQNQISKNDASNVVAEEVCDDWISKNVYPKKLRSVAKQIKSDYDTFLTMAKYERNTSKPKTDS